MWPRSEWSQRRAFGARIASKRILTRDWSKSGNECGNDMPTTPPPVGATQASPAVASRPADAGKVTLWPCGPPGDAGVAPTFLHRRCRSIILVFGLLFGTALSGSVAHAQD